MAEKAYPALISSRLNVEYGQLGAGGAGWINYGAGGVPVFYANDKATSSWNNYFAGASRRQNGKIVDSIPVAIFNNYGINDSTAGGDTIRTKVTDWISDVRNASSTGTEIYFIIPFIINDTSPVR
jgi:hypothetical protein